MSHLKVIRNYLEGLAIQVADLSKSLDTVSMVLVGTAVPEGNERAEKMDIDPSSMGFFQEVAARQRMLEFGLGRVTQQADYLREILDAGPTPQSGMKGSQAAKLRPARSTDIHLPRTTEPGWTKGLSDGLSDALGESL